MDAELNETSANWRQLVVNGVTFEANDAEMTGREILVLSGKAPASEHQLILLRNNRTRLIGLDDKVDLKAEPGVVFRAFPGDRSYSLTFDEVGQVWGTDNIQVDELASIFQVDPRKEMVLEREDQPDLVLISGGVVSLTDQGTEEIVTRHKKPDFVLVTVITTAGFFPAEGAVRVRPEELVGDILRRAAKKLDLRDTETWVASFNGRDIDPSLTFAQNALSGAVELDWNPREGGGGHA